MIFLPPRVALGDGNGDLLLDFSKNLVNEEVFNLLINLVGIWGPPVFQ